MSSGGLRFWKTNYAASATLKNGTGGGAPARDEVSPFVMENCLNDDSSLLWQGTGSGFLDFDLGANKTIGALFALGHRGAPSTSAGITSIVTKYATAADGYPPAGWSTFTGGTITLGSGARRAGAILAATVSARYIRYDITAATAFTLGRVFVGAAVEYDFGQVASPGRRRTLVIPRLRNEVGSNPTITRVGDNHYLYELDYDTIDATMFAKVLGVATQDAPLVMVETDDSVLEVVLTEDSFLESLMFDVPALYNVPLRVRTLG